MEEAHIFVRSARNKMKRRIKIQGLLIFFAVTAAILFSKFLFPNWKKEALDEFLDALGISLILFGFLFRISARGYKAEMSANGSTLVRGGLYCLMRNPMYFGIVLIGLGVVLVLFQWWAFLLFIILFLALYLPQINREEDDLTRRFGEEYKDYFNKTPKYFPNIFTLFKIDLRDYLFLKWSWAKKELLPLIVLIASVISIETWEDVRLFGYAELVKELLELSVIIICFALVFILFYEKENISGKH